MVHREIESPGQPRCCGFPPGSRCLAALIVVLGSGCGQETSGAASVTRRCGRSQPARPSPPGQQGRSIGWTRSMAVNERVVWASGRLGTVVRTIDGGATWEVHVIPGRRDAWRSATSTPVSRGRRLGPRQQRRSECADLHKRPRTAGRPGRWSFQSPIANTFYDCFAFWTPPKRHRHSGCRGRSLRRDPHDRWTHLGEHRRPLSLRAAG